MGNSASLASGSLPARRTAAPRFALAVCVAFVMHVVVLVPARLPLSGADTLGLVPAMSVRLLTASDGPARSSVTDPGIRAGAAEKSAAAASPEPLPIAAARPRDRTAPTTSAVVVRPPVEPVTTGADRPATVRLPGPASPDASPPKPALPPAPDYLKGGALDRGPRPLHDIEPVFPARAGQLQGSVVLRLLISEQGVVDNAAVVRASPAGFFEDSAIEAFTAARFSPGTSFGVAVKSQITIEVEFTPINRGAAVTGATY